MTEMQYKFLVMLGPTLKIETGMSKAGSAREGGARADGHRSLYRCRRKLMWAAARQPLGDAVGCVFGHCRGLGGRIVPCTYVDRTCCGRPFGDAVGCIFGRFRSRGCRIVWRGLQFHAVFVRLCVCVCVCARAFVCASMFVSSDRITATLLGGFRR